MANELRTRDGLPFNFVDGLRIKGVDVTNWDKVFIDQGASYVGFTPVGNLAASNVQAAIAEPESEKQSKTEPITTAINLRPGANQGIVWDNDAFGGGMDTASITLETAGGEATKMRFKMTNDLDDSFEFTAKSGDGLTDYNNAMSLNGNVLLNAANYVDYAAPMIVDYTALRAYTGNASQVRITSNGLAGFFYYDASDTVSADNGGTIIVSSNGKRWKRHYSDAASVNWFGAKGDGVTDDTAAIKLALLYCDSIYFPPGVYLVGETLYTRGAIDPINGRYKGKTLFGAGVNATVIKAKAGFGSDLLLHVGNKDYPSSIIYCVGNKISDMSFDIENLPNTPFASCILTQGTFNNKFSNLRIGLIESPRARWDINANIGTYTTTFTDVHCGQIQCSSATVGDVTTVWFIGCSGTFVNLLNANAIGFDHFTMQGEPSVQYQTNRFQITNSNNISVVDGDLEGNGVMFSVNSSNGIKISGNNVAMNGSYTPFGGVATRSTFISAENSTEINSGKNIFMNWLKDPLTPQSGIYLDESGAPNRFMNVFDFNGNSFTGARYRHTGGVTIPAGSAQVINFSEVDFDTGTQILSAFPDQTFSYAPFVTTGSLWNFLTPLRGYYEIDAALMLEGLNQASDVAFIAVYVGGSEYTRLYGAISAGGVAVIQIHTTVFANPSVEVQIKVFHNGSGTVKTLTASTSNSISITFKGAR